MGIPLLKPHIFGRVVTHQLCKAKAAELCYMFAAGKSKPKSFKIQNSKGRLTLFVPPWQSRALKFLAGGGTLVRRLPGEELPAGC